MSSANPPAIQSKPPGSLVDRFAGQVTAVRTWPMAVWVLLLGLLALYGPTYYELAHTVWSSEEQAHGPIIVAVSLWLFYKAIPPVSALAPARSALPGFALLAFGLFCYVFGKALTVPLIEVGSQVFVIAGVLIALKGTPVLRLTWFPLFFLIFMVPLPDAFVSALTAPLKNAVSAVASELLYLVGYPIGRAGTILTIGPYQLLVADACAGLNSMFTLEALGLLYLNLMNYTSIARNITLAILVIPISFLANVIRVSTLVLVTYYFGDEVGQGFAHGFAGMVLFMAALILILATDTLLGKIVFRSKVRKSHD
jgi:exosortase B